MLLRADNAGAAGWPNGPGRGPPISFTSSSDLRAYRRAVAGSSKEVDFLTGYEAAPAMRRPSATVHARLTSSCFNMLPFDIRHPSRDALQKSLIARNFYMAAEAAGRCSISIEIG